MLQAGVVTDEVPAGMIMIPARSQRQAMDWSLVLTSQGIETSIEHGVGSAPWGLIVADWEHERALEAIRLFRLENRRWGWRQPLPESGLTWHWGALLWCVLALVMHAAATLVVPGMAEHGMVRSEAVFAGEWWRVFTAVWLHGDVGHLAGNATSGFVLLGLAMARYGGGMGLLAAFLAGAVGNVAGLAVHPQPFLGLGASGMVMGGLGLVAAQSYAGWRESPRAGRYVLAGVGAGGFLFVLLGADPASDVIAHAGGFLSGCLGGALLSLVPPATLQRADVRFVSAMGFALLVALTWGLALR